MPRAADVLLDVRAVVLEVRLSEPLHRVVRRGELGLVLAHAKADAATARGALQHHRVSDGRCRKERFRDVRENPRSRKQGNAALLGDGARRVFQTEIERICSGVGPMNASPSASAASANAAFSLKKP